MTNLSNLSGLQKIKTILLVFSLLISTATFAKIEELPELTATQNMGELFKKEIEKLSPEQIKDLMETHYNTFDLADDGVAKNPLYGKYVDMQPSKETLLKLVDQIVEETEKTQYLNQLGDKFLPKDITDKRWLKQIPQTVTFAYALNKLTDDMINDQELRDEVLDHWHKRADVILENPSFFKNPLKWAEAKTVNYKFRIMEKPVLGMNNFIKNSDKMTAEEKQAFHDEIKHKLKDNILWASKMGKIFYFDFANAKVGDILAKAVDNLDLTPSVTVCDNGGNNSHVKELSLPMEQEWLDLYRTWNMVFISRFMSANFIFPKLVLPVLNAQSDQFLYRRALNLHAVSMYSRGMDYDLKHGKRKVFDYQDLSNKKFTTALGNELLDLTKASKFVK